MDKICASLITGASSGIGAALAHALAHPGAMLHLSGRDHTRLGVVAARCRERRAIVETRVLDVCEVAAMADWIGAAGQLDIVIANAQAASAARGVSVVDGLAARTTELFAAACDGGALAP
jgi:NADP-dependent 3-hydroxy acid dehydrogenase YdfG